MADIDPLRRLIAIDEIKRMKARYFRLVDDKQWTDLRELLTDNARFEFPGLGSFDDPDSCIEGIRSALTGTLTVHHGHTPEIDVTGHDTATGVWLLADHVIREEGSTGIVPGYPEEFRPGHRGYGRYYETYRHQFDGWRIASLRFQRILIEPLATAGGNGGRTAGAAPVGADPSTG
jgi:hypothetical protein